MEQRDGHDRGVAGGGGGGWARAGAGEGLEGGELHPGRQLRQRSHLDQPQSQAQALLCQHSQKCAPVLVIKILLEIQDLIRKLKKTHPVDGEGY